MVAIGTLYLITMSYHHKTCGLRQIVHFTAYYDTLSRNRDLDLNTRLQADASLLQNNQQGTYSAQNNDKRFV